MRRAGPDRCSTGPRGANLARAPPPDNVRRTPPPPGNPETQAIAARTPDPMTLDGTTPYVVGERPAYVIDPGPADPGHVAAVRAAAEERHGLGGVLLTHSHGD